MAQTNFITWRILFSIFEPKLSKSTKPILKKILLCICKHVFNLFSKFCKKYFWPKLVSYRGEHFFLYLCQHFSNLKKLGPKMLILAYFLPIMVKMTTPYPSPYCALSYCKILGTNNEPFFR